MCHLPAPTPDLILNIRGENAGFFILIFRKKVFYRQNLYIGQKTHLIFICPAGERKNNKYNYL